jgi:hypothetical protein
LFLQVYAIRASTSSPRKTGTRTRSFVLLTFCVQKRCRDFYAIQVL